MIAKGKITAVDLYAGAGGTSTGLYLALRDLGLSDEDVELLAINHWKTAIETHKRNHPLARHLESKVEDVRPEVEVPSGRLDLLVASPECKHFSRSLGGKPRSDQRRAGAWNVVQWCSDVRVDRVLVENVPEFRTWGPVDDNGKPIPELKGTTFRAWVQALETLGYIVEDRVLCAADYGDATTRDRLFIQAWLRRRPVWPEKTHFADGVGGQRHRAAAEILRWDVRGRSIFRPEDDRLADNTLERAYAGLVKFDWPESYRYALRCYIDGKPLPDYVRPNGCEVDLATCAPLTLPQGGGGIARPATRPLSTIATDGAIGLIAPYYGMSGCAPVSRPLGTVTTRDRFAFVAPVTHHGSVNRARSVDRPLQTITLVAPCPGEFIDIEHRMLIPPELAAAMSFPEDYHFEGNKTEVVAQIGNAVAVRQARALLRVIVGAA